MTRTIYDFDRQRKVNRNPSNKIQSIKPIYDENLNKFNEFFKMLEELKGLSMTFPQQKIVAEMQNVPSNQYALLKDDVGIGEAFTDHSSKFFYQVNINCVMIVHEMI